MTNFVDQRNLASSGVLMVHSEKIKIKGEPKYGQETQHWKTLFCGSIFHKTNVMLKTVGKAFWSHIL
jgi:hypothetical protein